MKSVVATGEKRESELRSDQIFEKYIILLNQDIPKYFVHKETKERMECPACGSDEYTNRFQKLGFLYRDCDNCKTMFVSHRATDQELETYFQKSLSHKFFLEEYLENIEQAHGVNIQSTRTNWIFDSVLQYDAPKEKFLDLNSKYPYFLNNIANSSFFEELLIARPEFNQKNKTLPQFKQTKSFKDNKDCSISVITAFEYFEGIFNPENFIKQAYRILDNGGLLFVTTRCISGFDLQILRENSNSILPPRHISLFSIEGLITFFESNGFVIQELSTPGLLDLDIVAKALKRDSRLHVPEFIKYILEKRDSETQRSFRRFLQENRLSSYVRVVAQKNPIKG